MINRYKKGKYAKMLSKVLQATFYFGHTLINRIIRGNR